MTAQELMVKDPLTVNVGTPIVEVARLLHKNGVAGLPVVNDEHIVQGIITERELFSNDFELHYPTYIELINKTDFVLGGNKTLPYEAGRITRIQAQEIMNRHAFFAPQDLDLKKVAGGLLAGNAPIAPVVDSSNHLLGVISKGDLLNYFSGAHVEPKKTVSNRTVDREFEYVQKDLSSRFAFVTKARANIWLTAATVLFIVGFLAGVIYVVNPNIFSFRNGKIQIQNSTP